MKKWHHAPIHIVDNAGTYMVTAGTYRKHKYFDTRNKIEFLHDTLIDCASEFSWELQAWAVMSNHYHFIAISQKPENLVKFISKVHAVTSRFVNRIDDSPGRKVWFQYWDTQITHQSSYLARLSYVHYNPVHHRLVEDARAYEWCSASWFGKNSEKTFYKAVTEAKIDRVKVEDDFDGTA